MQYALLIYTTPGMVDHMGPDEMKAMHDEYMAISALPEVVGGAQLQPTDTATSVRGQNGQALITDGPFADTKEVFAGFYLLEAENLDGALEVAQRIPAAHLGGVVEVRALVEG